MLDPSSVAVLCDPEAYNDVCKAPAILEWGGSEWTIGTNGKFLVMIRGSAPEAKKIQNGTSSMILSMLDECTIYKATTTAGVLRTFAGAYIESIPCPLCNGDPEKMKMIEMMECSVCEGEKDHTCTDCDNIHTCKACDGTGLDGEGDEVMCEGCDGEGKTCPKSNPVLLAPDVVVDSQLLASLLRTLPAKNDDLMEFRWNPSPKPVHLLYEKDWRAILMPMRHDGIEGVSFLKNDENDK